MSTWDEQALIKAKAELKAVENRKLEIEHGGELNLKEMEQAAEHRKQDQAHELAMAAIRARSVLFVTPIVLSWLAFMTWVLR